MKAKIPEIALAELQIKKMAVRLAEAELALAVANTYVALGLRKDARIDMATGEIDQPEPIAEESEAQVKERLLANRGDKKK